MYIEQVMVIHNCVVIIIDVVVVVIMVYDSVNYVFVCACACWKIGWADDNGRQSTTNAEKTIRFFNETYSARFEAAHLGHSDFFCICFWVRFNVSNRVLLDNNM